MFANLEELGSHGVGGGVGVWVAEKRLDARQDGRHVIGRRPAVLTQESNVEGNFFKSSETFLYLEDVETDASICVNVWVEHLK